MSISLIEIHNKHEWDTCIKECHFYDFYHTYDYHELSKSGNETPLLLKYIEGGVLIAIPLLVRQIPETNYKDATSVYGYVGPVSKGVNSDFNNHNFKKALFNYFKSNNYVAAFSRLNPFVNNQKNILKDVGTVSKQGSIVNIDINLPLEEQRQIFQSRLKTHINKSRRNCSVKIAKSKDDLEAFINIYYGNMDRVKAKKSYYFSRKYFNSIMASDDFESIILLATENKTKKIIAGCLFVITNNIVQYHLSGTLNDFLHLTPTKLLIDEMRVVATKRNLQFFNLGGGLGGRDDDSLFRFKSSFSKDFKNFYLWKLVVNQKVYNDLVKKNDITMESDFFPLYRSKDEIKY